MNEKTILKQAKEQTKQFAKFAQFIKPLKVRVIVITLLLMLLLLGGCVENNTLQPLGRENCRQYVVTYGDVVECMIKLDERQENLL